MLLMLSLFFVFFFKQKTAYEMRISDWSSDVCSSDLFFNHLLKGALRGSPLSAEGVRRRPWRRPGRKLSPPKDWLDERWATAPMKIGMSEQIGRASCRERVCQYV